MEISWNSTHELFEILLVSWQLQIFRRSGTAHLTPDSFPVDKICRPAAVLHSSPKGTTITTTAAAAAADCVLSEKSVCTYASRMLLCARSGEIPCIIIWSGVRDLCHMPVGVTSNTCVFHRDCHSEHVSYFRQFTRVLFAHHLVTVRKPKLFRNFKITL